MLTINNQLKLTEPTNKIICNYTKKVVLRDFLLKFSFSNNTNNFNKIKKKDINEWLEDLNYNFGDIGGNNHLPILEFIWNYHDNLGKYDLTALYYLVINENYFHYLDEFQNYTNIDLEEDEFDFQFGRELAYKLYLPEESLLYEDLEKFLLDKLSCFSSELDLSLIDKYSVTAILETIDSYTINHI